MPVTMANISGISVEINCSGSRGCICGGQPKQKRHSVRISAMLLIEKAGEYITVSGEQFNKPRGFKAFYNR